MTTPTINKVLEALRLHREAGLLHARASHILASGPADFYYDKFDEYLKLLFSPRCAPFQPGDRVRLTKAPKIDKDNRPGWQHCKHFLVEGATGTVDSVDANAKGFNAAVKFDNESWTNSQTGEQTLVKPDDRGLFGFHESFLEVVQEQEG